MQNPFKGAFECVDAKEWTAVLEPPLNANERLSPGRTISHRLGKPLIFTFALDQLGFVFLRIRHYLWPQMTGSYPCLNPLREKVKLTSSCVVGSDGMNGHQDQYQKNCHRPQTQVWIKENLGNHGRCHILASPSFQHEGFIKNRRVPTGSLSPHPRHSMLCSLENVALI